MGAPCLRHVTHRLVLICVMSHTCISQQRQSSMPQSTRGFCYAYESTIVSFTGLFCKRDIQFYQDRSNHRSLLQKSPIKETIGLLHVTYTPLIIWYISCHTREYRSKDNPGCRYVEAWGFCYAHGSSQTWCEAHPDVAGCVDVGSSLFGGAKAPHM